MEKDEEHQNDSELTPREYQSLLLEECIRRNTILYLPTGSGKTYIAVMLIKHMSADLEGTIDGGGKRTFFMVNTVALVSQQASYIRRHTPLIVGEFSGDMKVDYWTKEVWWEHLNKSQVLVMTTQIFRDILLHDYIHLRNVNLLIFDECHHAVRDHNMAQVMELFNDCHAEDLPRVLGMTATILNSDCKIPEVQKELENLEKTYWSKIASLDDWAMVHGYSTNPDEVCYSFKTASPTPIVSKVKIHINQTCEWVLSAKLDIGRPVPELPIKARPLHDGLKYNKKLRNIMTDVSYHVDELGIYGGSIAAIKHIIQLERLRAKAEDSRTSMLYLSMITTLNLVRKLLEDEMASCDDKNRIFQYSTPKVLRLIEIMKKLKPEKNAEAPRGIIFVERRYTAKVIFLMLKYLKKWDEEFAFLNPEFMVGFQNNPFNTTREGDWDKHSNMKALLSFTFTIWLIMGCLKPTPTDKLCYLAGIAPPCVCREVAAYKERLRVEQNSAHHGNS